MRCILTVNYSPWSRYSGGGQRSTHNLARALVRRGHRVSVVFTKAPWEQVRVPADLPYEVVWAALPLARRGSPFFVQAAVGRLLSQAGESELVVHGNGEEAALVPGLRRSHRFAFVMTPRYPNFPDVLLKEPAERSLLALAAMGVVTTKFLWLGKALRGADRVCPTSRSAASMVTRAYGLSPAQLTVVPNGISDEFLEAAHTPTPLPDTDPALKAFVADGPFAIFFGRIDSEKGVHTVVEALGHRASQDARVVFAGRGPDLQKLASRASALGIGARVHFTSWLDAAQLASLVQRATFAVLPSLEESFGNTMAESMALGVPVLSTTAGSIPEVVKHGEHGLLVPPDDAQALAAAIGTLGADPALRARLGAAGKVYASAHFTWDASAAAFERVYAQALARNRER